MQWRERLSTQADIDREYNAVAPVPDLAPYMAHDAEANERARRGLRLVQEGRNHFTSFRDPERPDGPLTVRLLDFIGRNPDRG